MRHAALIPALALLIASASQAQVPPDEASEHVVQSGETLGGIAIRAKVPRILIAEANGLKPPYNLRAGQKLKIPRTRRHTVQAGESGFAIAYAYAVPWKDIAVANGLASAGAIRPGQVLLIPTIVAVPETPAPQAATTPAAASRASAARFAWPLEGTLRRGFTPRGQAGFHDGIDITVTRGTTVKAAAAGKVIFAGDKGDYGNLVIVDHGDGWHSTYGFLSRITVSKGETVTQGEPLGLSGNTGIARGDELHFELRRDNRPVNPVRELPGQP
jgi:murein DD-endopeptidase MepM/ murein hydrolase activator NlpD